MRQRKPKGQHKTECSKCGGEIEENRVGKYRYCLTCHNAYMVANRSKYVPSEDEKKKITVRHLTKVYIQRWNVEIGVCAECGTDKNIEVHHPDYDNFKLIVWYCRKHHLDFHKGLIKAATPILITDENMDRERNPRGQFKTTCSNPACGKELEEDRKGKQRYCLDCHAANMREYRRKKAEERERELEEKLSKHIPHEQSIQ